MSSNTKEWITVAVFFIGFFAFTFGEMYWLSRGDTAKRGRFFAFAFVSNIFSVSVGFFVSFIIFGVLMAMAWDGSLETIPSGDGGIWAAVAVAAIFPVLLLTLAKRLLFRGLKLTDVPRPWLYSIAASILFFLVVIGLPFLFVYFT